MRAEPTDPFAMESHILLECLDDAKRELIVHRLEKNCFVLQRHVQDLAKQNIEVPVSIFECVDDSFVEELDEDSARTVLDAGLYELFIKYIECKMDRLGSLPSDWLCEFTKDSPVPEWCLTQKTAALLCANVQNVYGAIALDVSHSDFDVLLSDRESWMYRCVTYIGSTRYVVGNINIERLADDLDRPETRDIVRGILRRLNIELFPAIVYKQLVGLQRKAGLIA